MLQPRVSLVLVVLFHIMVSVTSANELPQAANGKDCQTAEACYAAAMNAGAAESADGRRRLKVEQLRALRQRFPDSPWAQRAGAVVGLLVLEREPAEAGQLFAAVRPNLPVLEDYLRLWEAEARARTGAAAEAAQGFETIGIAVPETLLKSRAAFGAGQAWFKASDCKKAMPLLQQGVANDPQAPSAPVALLNLADCQVREGADNEARQTLKQIWVKYPQSAAARDAQNRLGQAAEGGVWKPSPDDVYARAQTLAAAAAFAEAVDEFNRFLVLAPEHQRRDEAKLKLASALMRLKRYDQAKTVLQDLVSRRAGVTPDAVQFLARIYLRVGDGDRLLALRQSLTGLSLAGSQRATVHMMTGLWFEDQRRWDDALTSYRDVLAAAPTATQRSEAIWRAGWINYRNGAWDQALARFQELLDGKDDPQWTPQVMYWRARVLERRGDPEAKESYRQVCRQYWFTYYCQLAKGRADIPQPGPSAVSVSAAEEPAVAADSRGEIERDLHYRKAQELRILKQDADAARELNVLTERYAKSKPGALSLSLLLSQAGAHYEALRLVRGTFRDSLERGGEAVPAGLWAVAYPPVYLPNIRQVAGPQMDPLLAAAIIREESQYDSRAVSRVGAIGLMQLMPETARGMARKIGAPEAGREDLFDQETNIRYGTQYLGQLIEQFAGNLAFGVAAYNAGPPAVTGWITKNGAADIEEFVELIPYQETRYYVKRVMRSYWEYRRLYGEPCLVARLDKAC